MQKFLVTLFVLSVTFPVFAQQADSLAIDTNAEVVIIKPDNTAPLKLGIKFGTGASSMLGGEMENPSPVYTLNGGVYARYRFKKRLITQAECNVSIRGSNFNHKADEYQSIRLYYVDVPLLFCYALTEKRDIRLVAGAQYSRLINSFIFVNPATPEAGEPALKKNEFSVAGGLQLYTPFVGFQLLGKYGLTDINNGLLPTVKPYNQGRDIHNFVIEFNFLF